MRTSTLRRSLFAALTVLITLLAVLPGADAQPVRKTKITSNSELTMPSAQRRAPSVLNIVGDSYISGTGIESTLPGTYDANFLPDCKRSSAAYGGLLNDALNNRPYTIPFVLPAPLYPASYGNFVACGGAKTENINDVAQNGLGTQLSQFPPIASGRSGVTVVAIGGNDLGFEPVLTNCIVTVDCHLTSALPEIVNVDANIAALAPVLGKTYSDILLHREIGARHAVFVVGYPQIFGDSAACAPAEVLAGVLGEISASERAWMDQLALDLNAQIEAVASSMKGVRYIDIDDAFEGHRACDPEPWINGIEVADLGESFHPNHLGHEAMLPVVLAAIDAAGL